MEKIEGLYSAIDISASGLTAQRTKMNIIAANIANIDTTRTPEGGPYKRKQVIFEQGEKAKFMSLVTDKFKELKRTHKDHFSNEDIQLIGEEYARSVKVAGILEDPKPPRLVYDPDHPDADENGFVAYPNINIVTEMVNMIAASRAYEANVTTMNASKTMMQEALEI